MSRIGAKIALFLISIPSLYAQTQKASFPRPVWPNLDVPHRTSEFNFGWASVNNVCGYLRPNAGTENDRATLWLYRAEPGRACCNDRELVGHQEASESGFFAFGNAKPGRFWLVVNSDGADYAATVSVDSRNDPVGCYDQILVHNGPGRSWTIGRKVTAQRD